MRCDWSIPVAKTLSSKPFRVRPPNALNYFLLSLQPTSHVNKLIYFHQEVVEDASWQDAARSLSQEMHFAEEETVVLVGNFAVFCGCCAGKDAIDVAQDEQHAALPRPHLDAFTAAEDASEVSVDADTDENTRRQTDEAKEQLLALENAVNTAHRDFHIDLGLLHLNEQCAS